MTTNLVTTFRLDREISQAPITSPVDIVQSEEVMVPGIGLVSKKQISVQALWPLHGEGKTQPTTIDKIKEVAGYILLGLGALLIAGGVTILTAYIVGVLPLMLPTIQALFMTGLAALITGIHLAQTKDVTANLDWKIGDMVTLKNT